MSRRTVYLLAGGQGSRRSAPDPLLAEVFAQVGPGPSVAYVGAASGDNAQFFLMLSGYMKKSGAGSVSLVRLAGRQKPDAERASRELEAADVVFMSGGDVDEGMAVVERTGIAPVLEALFRAGKPFFGLSAGSIMLAQRWIRWADPDDDSSASAFDCLGFAPVIIDTHGEDEGWVELVALIGREPEGTVGYGIPTGAGLRVGPDGALAAAGGPVHRFERSGATVRRIADLDPS
jgi:cyanophycinase-like exopeptidase